MNNVLDVAQHILDLAKKDGVNITPMKLLKITYIAYGWFSISGDGRLFADKIEAWQYGPVIPNLYRNIKKFKDSPITEQIGDASKLEENKQNWVNKVYELYRGYNSLQLSSMTHQDNSPWHQVYKSDIRSIEIPDNNIKNYYNNLYEQANRT